MVIDGIQKLTLLDYPGKTACTVFLSGCNYRCPFCHNAGLVLRAGENATLREDEFFDFLQKRKNTLDGVCISGGEPTLRPELEEFIGQIKHIGYLVKLDTNGSRPDVIERLIENKLLDYVAMDIKSSKSGYSRCTGTAEVSIPAVQRSIDILSKGNITYEFRTTLVRELHTCQDIIQIGLWLRGAPQYYLQQFRDSGDTICGGLTSYGAAQMEELLRLVRDYIPAAQLRGAN